MLCTTQRKFRSSHFNSVVKGKGPGSCLRNWIKSCLNILQGSWSYWSNFSWNSTWKISSNLSLCSILTIPACEVILGCRAAGVWTSAEMCWGEVQLMMASYRRSFNSSSVKQNCSNKWFVQRYAKLKVTNSETNSWGWLVKHPFQDAIKNIQIPYRNKTISQRIPVTLLSSAANTNLDPILPLGLSCCEATVLTTVQPSEANMFFKTY